MVCAKSQSEAHLQALQGLNRVSNKMREVVEQARYWDAIKDTCILQGYMEGKLSMILNVDTWSESNSVFPASFNRDADSFVNLTAFISQCHVFDSGIRRQFEKQEMLVRDIKIVKGADNGIIPSVVGLYYGNHAIEEGFTSGIYLNSMKGAFEIWSAFPYGKLGVVRDFVGQMSVNRAEPSEVQGTMQIVDDIADNQGKIEKRIFEFWDFVHEAFSKSFIFILNCGGVSILQRQQGPFRLRDMLIGPFDFEMGLPKRCGHSGDIIIGPFG